MKLAHLLILLDMLLLPLPVFWKRIKKRLRRRFFNPNHTQAHKQERAWQKPFASLPIPLVKPNELAHLKLVLRHYQQGRFNHLGSGWLPWHHDAKPTDDASAPAVQWLYEPRGQTTYAPQHSPSQALRQAFNTPGVDVKHIWEPARFQHLPQLAIAQEARLLSPTQAEALVQAHLQAFAQQVPYGKSIHYASPMELSIRLCNWLLAWEWGRWTKLEGLFTPLLSEHYSYVQQHLEHQEGLGTNHYLSNLMALVVAGAYLPQGEGSHTTRWAWDEFEKELAKQFLEDGGNFEYSTYYHRLSTEMALLTVGYACRQKLHVKPATWDILRQALAFLKGVLKPDGSLPQFGDNDSGRIIDLLPKGDKKERGWQPNPECTLYINDIQNPETLYGQFFQGLYGDNYHQLLNVSVPIAGFKAPEKFPELKYQQETLFSFAPINLESVRRYAWPHTGIYVYRSDDFYLAINVMSNPRGHRYRGHMHNDKGQVELQVHGQDFLRDPGVFSYTASVEQRNRYRSNRAHFVPFTGREQNRYLPTSLGLFHATLDATCRVLQMQPQAFACLIEYRGVKHLRIIKWQADKLTVRDFCNKPFTLQHDKELKPTSGYGKYIDE